MKKISLLFLSLFTLLSLSACGRQEGPPPEDGTARETVQLTVWGAEALLQEIFSSFQGQYAGQADIQITYQAQSESSCKDALLGNLEGGADVFAFADDQVAALAAAGGLDPIGDSAVVQGSSLSAAVEAASVGGTLYAYPLTADNGYFLYYNKAYFSEEDIQRPSWTGCWSWLPRRGVLWQWIGAPRGTSTPSSATPVLRSVSTRTA